MEEVDGADHEICRRYEPFVKFIIGVIGLSGFSIGIGRQKLCRKKY